jgi:hypothetical protein
MPILRLAIPATLAWLLILPHCCEAQTSPEKRTVDICAILGWQDTKPFVASSVGKFSQDPFTVGCKWTSKDRALVISIFRSTEDTEYLWNSEKQKYQESRAAVVQDEKGIGERAFSVVLTSTNGAVPLGVTFFVVQENRHVLRVSFESKKPGTEQMRDALRATVKKVAGATL